MRYVNNIILTTNIMSTTNLDDLPTSEENVKLETNESKPQLGSDMNANTFVNGIQQAAASGALELQSCDIPQTQTHLTQDEQTQPNYIPSSEKEFLIPHHLNREEPTENIDKIYEEIQTPILLAVMYFIFQLPLVKKTLLRMLPLLFKDDGNMNLSGYIAKSTLFALVYYALTVTMKYFSL